MKKDFLTAVCISDTHGQQQNIDLSRYQSEFLIHSGDFTMDGKLCEIYDFCKWLDSLTQFKHKIVVAGNHDQYLDKKQVGEEGAQIAINRLQQSSNYLNNSSVELEGIKFYGSPYTLTDKNWTFGLKGPELDKVWEMIPEDVDILVTHSPALGILDKLHFNDKHIGSGGLRKKVLEIKPSYHVFGHIHECYGLEQVEDTLFINASQNDVHYKLVNMPIVIPIRKKKGC